MAESIEPSASPRPASAPRPRQKRALRTCERLIAATEALVAAEGEDAVTTSRVAQETGVAVGTIYRYFPDREALLLAAYDGTVGRIVAACGDALADLAPDIAAEDAARRLLGAYLAAAEAVPAHARLLRAMRAIRPVEHDQGESEDRIVGQILRPFLARYAAGGTLEPSSLHFLNVLMGTLVDLYLVAEGAPARRRLLADIEAHMLLALRRVLNPY